MTIEIITDPLEIIRSRPGVVIKDLTCQGFHNLVSEAIKKALDPLTNNNPEKCSLIFVDNTLVFHDNGNGLNIVESNLERTMYILTTMLVGDPPKDSQTYSSLNFLFNLSPILIATSAYFSITTVSKNNQYYMSCVNGCIENTLHKVDKNIEKGTIINILPDSKIWGKCEINTYLIANEISNFINQMNLKIDLHI
jgi:DNA gyrase/topoisomerase IV subunit B